jgi:uncharacterized membrane protein YeiH
MSGATPVTAVILGTVSGVAGGAMRDVLCGEIPLIFRGEVYALASLAGGAVYMLLRGAGVRDAISLPVAIAIIFSARVSAIVCRLQLPGIRDSLPRLKASAEVDENA